MGGPAKMEVTNRQRKFLRLWAGGDKSALEAMDELKVQRHLLEQWMCSRRFRQALRRRLRGMRMIRELDVSRGAEQGARRLAKAAHGAGDFGKDKWIERVACRDLVELARAMEREQEQVRRRKREREREEEEDPFYQHMLRLHGSPEAVERVIDELEEMKARGREEGMTGVPGRRADSGRAVVADSAERGIMETGVARARRVVLGLCLD